MTARRASDIQHGRGDRPTRAELVEYARWQAKFGGDVTAGMKRMAAQLKAGVRVWRRRIDTQAARRPALRGGGSRSARPRSTRRARPPGRSTGDDPESDLAARLTGLLAKHGATSACWLAAEVGRRKSTVLEALHAGPFVQVGKGRGARWANQPAPVVPEPYRDAVWKARRQGAIDAEEALGLLLEPSPLVLELLAARAAA